MQNAGVVVISSVFIRNGHIRIVGIIIWFVFFNFYVKIKLIFECFSNDKGLICVTSYLKAFRNPTTDQFDSIQSICTMYYIDMRNIRPGRGTYLIMCITASRPAAPNSLGFVCV